MDNERITAFTKELKKIRALHKEDIETCHREMDALIIGELRALGYTRAMDNFEKQTKWYS